MRVGVVGAGGKMGREVCRMVAADPELELVAAVDPECTGEGAGGLAIVGELDALVDGDAEVVVDFTRAAAARTTLAWCAAHGIHAVVGTTGFDDRDLATLGDLFAGPDQRAPNCVLAANFAIGAVLMMRFAEIAAPWFDAAEIVELHHDGKLDAPSGTSLQTAARMAAARVEAGADPYPADATTTVMVEGARGGSGPGGVRMHSVRLTGLVAHQEVLLGSVGQSLTLRHDSYERTSFMAGVALAIKAVASRPGLTVGLEPLLGL
ncbi:MAG TPA: 4-hydroxy-tetrahydrodipicolinate reductase [Acidimicrobiales bacterium]|nr:4-hydroxy-tetrahydrodipicolinate reductase [Acidimicrobiales bacterium]